MRVCPLAIWGCSLDPDELSAHARDDARLTHQSPVCHDAAALFVVTVARAIAAGGSAREVYDFADRWAAATLRERAVTDALHAAASAPPADFFTHQGWVLLALQNAFFRLLHSASVEDAIVQTVAAGGDTDTNAAIAGALVGAVHGREQVPHAWRQMVLTCRPLAGLPHVHRPRPRIFWPVDALAVAERLVSLGTR
jgi:ADP-ribosylglycohydrolase